LAAVFAFYRPVPALAQAVPGVAVTGTCGVVDTTCVHPDTSFVPTIVRVSVSAGVTTVDCEGTTINKPAIATACDGESLNRKSTEAMPAFPCSIMLGATSVGVDDWHETISTSGSVKLTCSAGGTDTK
jgi:hypothetical protein